MSIREIVSRLENIEIQLSEKGIDSECEMVAELIDTIIADDLNLATDKPKVSTDQILDTLVKMGIESGTIGQA
tara:strand:- start:171 stop:389 length:219 start_codon:yes stop_codon:yes gene_type:complete